MAINALENTVHRNNTNTDSTHDRTIQEKIESANVIAEARLFTQSTLLINTSAELLIQGNNGNFQLTIFGDKVSAKIYDSNDNLKGEIRSKREMFGTPGPHISFPFGEKAEYKVSVSYPSSSSKTGYSTLTCSLEINEGKATLEKGTYVIVQEEA